MPTYIIRAGEDGPVKIGRAEDVGARVRALQTAHPETLNILRVIDGDGDIEGAFHERFSGSRRRGEWFEFDPGMLDFDPATVWAHAYTRRSKADAVAAANAALAEALSDISIRALSEVTGASARTTENWKAGRCGPDWRSVAAMLRDAEMRPLVLRAALVAEGLGVVPRPSQE